MEAVIKRTIPSLVPKGVFGDYEFVCINKEGEEEVDAQFSSQLESVNLKLLNPSGDVRIIPLIIKVQPTIQDGRDFKTMFYNEVTMYSEVLPFLNEKNFPRYPRMYYGNVIDGENLSEDVVILENLKTYGFEVCRQKVHLDYEHIAIAMKAIGEFHSWSYNSKAKDSKKFHEMANKLKRYEFMDVEEALDGASMRRGINLYLKTGKETEVLNRFLKTIPVTKRFLEFLHAPTEPFAVILHGDYCKFNMQYKYNENGSPADCAYFDFQTSKYGSPVVDLAFFLYMHTTQESRHHWDDYLKIYWTSVKDNVSEEVKLPTFEEFLKYFATKAVLGYFPCSFYLPMMIAPEEILPLEIFVTLPLEEKLFHINNGGGEKGGNLIRDIVAHLIERKYIHSFLDYYEKMQPY